MDFNLASLVGLKTDHKMIWRHKLVAQCAVRSFVHSKEGDFWGFHSEKFENVRLFPSGLHRRIKQLLSQFQRVGRLFDFDDFNKFGFSILCLTNKG